MVSAVWILIGRVGIVADKFPYMQFFTGDWLKDPALTLCAPATRGVWIDLLSAMHEAGRSGELCGTAEQLARFARCSTADLALALTDLRTNKAADVTERNGQITVLNRRMCREHNARVAGNLRQRRFRERHGHHKDVTPHSSSSTSFSNKSAAQTAPPHQSTDVLFDKFWAVFPSRRKKSKAKARESWERARKKVAPEMIVQAAIEYAASAEGRGEFAKMPSTWLNGECWEDDRQAWNASQTRGGVQSEKEALPLLGGEV